MTTTATHDGLVELSHRDCYRRLASSHLGRVALSIGALPVVLPVHYVLLDRDPVFRTDPGAKLSAAANGNVVCLEIDDADPESHTGWSVMVTGTADVITDPEELAMAERLPLRPWVGRGDAFVRIRATFVTGRKVVSGHHPAMGIQAVRAQRP
ncbi:hypothetical protein BH10ACT1_BH10ACT1_22840 [soil metagenome]